MNGINGSVAVSTTSATTTIAETDATHVTNKTVVTNIIRDNSMEISSNQIISELSNEDHYNEHAEYSTGKLTQYYSQSDFVCVIHIQIDIIQML